MPQFVKPLCKYLYRFAVFIPAIVFVCYLTSQYLRSIIDIGVVYLDWRVEQTVSVQNISSILEVALGLNVALSFLTSFSTLITNSFHKSVEQYNSNSNPTFLEAMNEVAEETGNEFGGGPINVGLVKSKFDAHIQAQIADFKDDALNSELLMKLLGSGNAIACFIALIAGAIAPAVTLPLAVFFVLVFSVLSPILIHLLTLAIQYLLYKYAIENGPSNGNKAMGGFIASVFGRYKKKKAQAKSIEISEITG
jgi:hypothetical protein